MIDASNVYGSDEERAAGLRAFDGGGRLRVSEGNLLPFNTVGLPNAGGSGPELFVAGDVRANEQTGLAVMHTLFVREHNRLVTELAAQRPSLSGDELYERARVQVIGLMQAITYNEFLPLLLGEGALPAYTGYKPESARGISNVFSAASYRFGHSALSDTLLRLDANGNTIAEGDLPLQDAIFNPTRITDEGGIEPILRGLAGQLCQQIDPFVIDGVRNFLFGAPGRGGFDLASLNIQRGRDHGLPSYNRTRVSLGLRPKRRFEDISSDPEMVARLASVYPNARSVDVWVGGLAEDRVEGAMVGELISRVLAEPFVALRDGDRFWYENVLSREAVLEIQNTTLADVIRRNTDIGAELPDNAFRVTTPRIRKSGRGKRRSKG